MAIKYVSVQESRAGEGDSRRARDDERTPKTSATPAAKTTHGGESASKTEEG